MEKRLYSHYRRMLQAILNKSLRQYPTKQQLYGHLPPITKTIQVRRIGHAWHRWRSRNELISDDLQWTPSHGRAKAGWPPRIYIQQLCEDTGCDPEDQPEAMNDQGEWRERIRDIRAGGTTRWGWWHISWLRLTIGLVGLGCRIHRLLLCRGVRCPQRVSLLCYKTNWWWGSRNAEALRNVEYPFIAIAFRSTLVWSGSTW